MIRIPYGGHIGAVEHHQESPETYFSHTPGLRVVSPSTPNDAYWMIQDAIASPDPVIFLEPKAKYWLRGEVDTSARALPLHASRIVRRGTDITLVGHGAMVSTMLQAAALAESEGTSCEVVDVRSLSPAGLRAHPRLGAAHRAHGLRAGGAGLREPRLRDRRDGHGARLLRSRGAGPACRASTPPSGLRAEGAFLPDADRILEAVDRSLAY